MIAVTDTGPESTKIPIMFTGDTLLVKYKMLKF
jgi:hypothetical protein